ncbi:hypothetical protein A0H81_11404 [Grifola frondosa]|uniref:Uncharacterized protein n=1 Tax=Grifola frondosa TaxID=5627 RepID=A0A1C7LWA5_GRIFR|nr:hypothetical protein A0H81_11404 [Grifola frondosa]
MRAYDVRLVGDALRSLVGRALPRLYPSRSAISGVRSETPSNRRHLADDGGERLAHGARATCARYEVTRRVGSGRRAISLSNPTGASSSEPSLSISSTGSIPSAAARVVQFERCQRLQDMIHRSGAAGLFVPSRDPFYPRAHSVLANDRLDSKIRTIQTSDWGFSNHAAHPSPSHSLDLPGLSAANPSVQRSLE